MLTGIRKKIVKTLYPSAFDEGSLLHEVEQHEARMAADPEVQRRKAESRAAINRENVPILACGLLFNAALWGGIASYLSWLVKPAGAALFFVATSVFLWKTIRL